MAKLTDEQLERAKQNLRAYARGEILKREMIQFRCEPSLMARLLDLVGERQVPLGPMIRQWVAERLEMEERGGIPTDLIAYMQLMEHDLRTLKHALIAQQMNGAKRSASPKKTTAAKAHNKPAISKAKSTKKATSKATKKPTKKK